MPHSDASRPRRSCCHGNSLELSTLPVDAKISLLSAHDQKEAKDAINFVFGMVNGNVRVNVDEHIYLSSEDVGNWQVQFSVARHILIIDNIVNNPPQEAIGAFDGAHICAHDANKKRNSRASIDQMRLILAILYWNGRNKPALYEDDERTRNALACEQRDIYALRLNYHAISPALMAAMVDIIGPSSTSAPPDVIISAIRQKLLSGLASSLACEKTRITASIVSASGNRCDFYDDLQKSAIAYKMHLTYTSADESSRLTMLRDPFTSLGCLRSEHREL